MIRLSDAGVKGANVDLIEIRLADDIGGKAFSIFGGSLEEVQAAVDIAKQSVSKKDFWYRDIIIPNIHADMVKQINTSTTFAKTALDNLSDGEF